MPCLSYQLLCFLFNKIGEQVVRIDSAGGGPEGQMAQAMYTYVNKCRNDKVKYK
jgi:hypothetical protein